MLRTTIQNHVVAAIERLIAGGKLPETAREIPVEVGEPKDPAHGDFALNWAMVGAKKLGMNPRQAGELLAGALPGGIVDAVEVAGPGFVNLGLEPAAVAAFVAQVNELGTGYANLSPARPERINIEFVSVNPNGPITVGSGRGAAFGSALARILQAAGHEVHREYYINDGVNSEQMRLFAESVRALAQGQPVPENGYKGEYVADVAVAINAGDPPSADDEAGWRKAAQELMIERQRGDLATFAVEFDTWFSEQSLHDQGVVAEVIEQLAQKGVADEQPFRTKLKLAKGGKVEDVEREDQPVDEDDADGAGATLWLRSTKFGDDMDRVLRRKDGRLTYIASDVAYHRDKFNRPPNADRLITVLGPDHHGYIGRLTAVVAALLETEGVDGLTNDGELTEIEAKLFRDPADRDACAAALAEAKRRLEVVIFQIVRFMKEGKPAPMRKRDGNIYELRDLVNEIGKNIAPQESVEEQQRIGRDVARFFYLMRSHDTHLDFDIDLATKQNDENPVFYAQYAHARICSVVRKAEEAGLSANGADLSLLVHPREQALIRKILDLSTEIERVAKDYGVHRITTYAVELGRAYHHFYDQCRVIEPDQRELSRARLALCTAARTGLRAAFDLLGVSAPERMDRATLAVPEA